MLNGKVGHIKWSYYVAADVHGYTVTRTKDTRKWSLSGVIGASDAYKLAQRPLVFVIPNEKGEWTWPIQSVSITDGVIRAELDSPA